MPQHTPDPEGVQPSSPNPHPTRLMRVLWAVREFALIAFLSMATLFLIVLLAALQEIGDRWDQAPAPAATQYDGCIGEVPC